MSEEVKMNELYHHGILGMKWGIRRTPAQLGHTPSGGSKDSTKARVKAIKGTANAKAKRIAEAGKRQAKIDKAQAKANAKISKAEEKYKTNKEEHKSKSISEMTDQEIRDKISRIRLERELKSLQPEQISRGKRFVQSVSKDVVGPAAKDAGRRILTDFFDKKGHELLGISNKEAKDGAAELKKQAEMLNNKKKINELNKYFANEEKRQSEAKAAEKKAREESKAAKKDSDRKYKMKKFEYDQEYKTQKQREKAQRKEERQRKRDERDERELEEWWKKNKPKKTQDISNAQKQIGQRYIAGLLEKKDD